MLKKITAAIMIFIITIGSTACSAKKKTRYEASFLGLFDTVTKIVAYSDSKEQFTKSSQSIHDNLKEYNDLYDIYHDYKDINNIKTINDNAGIKPVKVDKRIIDLLQLGKDKYKTTNGKLNIAMGSVLKIWHKYREDGLNDEDSAKLPSMAELQEAAKHTDINKLIIDKASSTVFLQDKDMSLDVGAIGKGYATEQVAQIAIKEGFTSGLLSVGGNIRAIGSKGENNEPWNLGIQNPDKESKDTNLCTVNLSDKSLVTSGDYERYYTVNGKNYHHIIDPNTLYPANYFHAVTIICKDSGLADALSTAVFNMPFDEGLKYINSLPDTDAMWVMENGEIKYSANFKKYIKNN
ncbi:MAG: rane-associated lipoprotein involved in thiamine biosynthesis [Clostridiaceae bacterium]|jgi:thiamine biosynthesis lipoprotein|nr:rane-associated lipoprotein involved in thiamine biosynthesis [Clostridiaceae bacterium]